MFYSNKTAAARVFKVYREFGIPAIDGQVLTYLKDGRRRFRTAIPCAVDPDFDFEKPSLNNPKRLVTIDTSPLIDRFKEEFDDRVEVTRVEFSKKMRESMARRREEFAHFPGTQQFDDLLNQCYLDVTFPPIPAAEMAPAPLLEFIANMLQSGSWANGLNLRHDILQRGKAHKPRLFKPGERVLVKKPGQKQSDTKYYYVTSYRAPGGGMTLVARDNWKTASYASVYKIEPQETE